MERARSDKTTPSMANNASRALKATASTDVKGFPRRSAAMIVRHGHETTFQMLTETFAGTTTSRCTIGQVPCSDSRRRSRHLTTARASW